MITFSAPALAPKTEVSFDEEMAKIKEEILKTSSDTQTYMINKALRLRDFPLLHAIVEFDSLRMGALTYDDFIRLGTTPGFFYAVEELATVNRTIMLRELRKFFDFLDYTKSGLLSLIQTNEDGEIDEIMRNITNYSVRKKYEAFSTPAYKLNSFEKQRRSDITNLDRRIDKMEKIYSDSKEYIQAKRKFIRHSEKVIKLGNYHIYQHDVPVLYLDQLQEGTKILHLSDILFTNDDTEKDIFLTQLSQSPEIDSISMILITGDIINTEFNEKIAEKIKRLGSLFKNITKGFVLGNHDYLNNSNHKVRHAMNKTGFIDYTNNTEKLNIAGKPFNIHGVDSFLRGNPKKPVLAKDRLEPNIMLSHNLDAINNTYPGAFDLVLSGHTHAGEIDLIVYNGYDFLERVGSHINLNCQQTEIKCLSQRTTSYISPGLHSHKFRFNTKKAGATIINLISEDTFQKSRIKPSNSSVLSKLFNSFFSVSS